MYARADARHTATTTKKLLTVAHSLYVCLNNIMCVCVCVHVYSSGESESIRYQTYTSIKYYVRYDDIDSKITILEYS